MAETPSVPLSGRRAEAARNDERILLAARAVFVADPHAPITAVAERAGVGISALYKRYAGKEDLLRTLCRDGLARFVAETEAALADEREPWTVFADYMGRLVAADTSSLTLALAGTFTPTEDMFALAEHANALLGRLFDRLRAVLRPDLVPDDLSLVFEILAAVKLPDRERTAQLRARYLAIVLDGLRAPGHGPLPGPPPGGTELSDRWRT